MAFTVRTVFKAPLLISSQGFLLVFLIGRCFKSGGDCNFKFFRPDFDGALMLPCAV